MRTKLSEKKPDRRIAKTKAALATALFEMIQTTDWNDISIQALCDNANVARSSFYAHFATVTELLESLMADNFPRFAELPPSPQQFATLNWLVDHITQNRALFSRIVNAPSASTILTRFKVQTKITLVQEFKAKRISCPEIYLDFLIGGIFESVQAWAKTWKISQISALKFELNQIAKTILKFDPNSI